jgi:hypothetical protein
MGSLEEEKNDSQSIHIPVSWGDDSGITTIYANQLLVSHAGPEFYLVFGEVKGYEVDILRGAAPDGTLPEGTTLQVKPVARIAISHLLMQQFAKLLYDNVFQATENKGTDE